MVAEVAHLAASCFQAYHGVKAHRGGDAEPMDVQSHWEKIYTEKAPDAVSWYRPHLETSLKLVEQVASGPSVSIIDVGGGESTLVDDLLARGYDNVTVLDVSQTAIDANRKRLGKAAERVRWLAADIGRSCGSPQLRMARTVHLVRPRAGIVAPIPSSIREIQPDHRRRLNPRQPCADEGDGGLWRNELPARERPCDRSLFASELPGQRGMGLRRMISVPVIRVSGKLHRITVLRRRSTNLSQ